MDYESALEYIHHCIDVGNIIFEIPKDEEIINAIKVALEKEVPKKVEKVVETEHFILCVCPSCGKDEYESRIGNYCRRCGQRLKLDD